METIWIIITLLIIPALGIWVAFLHYKVKKQKLKMDFYILVNPIYEAIKIYISNILINAKVTREELNRLLRNTREAKFIYGRKSDVVELINELYKKGLRLLLCRELIDGNRLNEKEHQKKVDEESEIIDWFTTHDIDLIFDKYLSLEEKRKNKNSK